MSLPNCEAQVFRGRYTGSYRVTTRQWDGPDTSRICFVFAGQGGVTRDAVKSAYERGGAVREQFDRADTFASAIDAPRPSSWFLDESMAGSPAARTLALFTLQAGLFEQLLLDGFKPTLLTGFSVGEFAAVVSAGMASFEDVFEILAHREKISPPPNELGCLIAVGAEAETLRPHMTESCCIANRNAPRQTVIAARCEARAEIEKMLRSRRLGYRVLADVAQPFHTPWLQPVADGVRAFIEKRGFAFRPPAVRLLSSVTKEFFTDADATVERMSHVLSQQIVAPVDFVTQVELALGEGCLSFLEIGPARVVSPLVTATAGDRFHKVLQLEQSLEGHQSDLSPAIAEMARSSRFLAPIQRVIARLTGYEIESIRIEQRFQEDLGVDSLKKADIIFTILDENGRELKDAYNAGAIEYVADAVTLLERSAPAGVSGGAAARQGHFRRMREVWVPAALPAGDSSVRPELRVVSVRDVVDGSVPATRLFDGGVAGAVLTTSPIDMNGALRVFASFRTLEQTGLDRDVTLILVSPDRGEPLARALSAFFKSLRCEMPRLFFRHVEVDSPLDRDALGSIAAEELASGREVDVRYCKGVRMVRVLEPAVTAEAGALQDGTVIVAFGAARGSGLALLRSLAERTRLRILLAGRSAGDDTAIASALELLTASGSEVVYEQADARDARAVGRLLDGARSRWTRVDYVVNAVGVDRIAPLAHQTDEDLRATIDVKIRATENILGALHEGERSVHFSSITSRYGNPGQTAYAYANAAINLLVDEHVKKASTGAVAINFPPWDGVGMTAAPLVYSELRRSGFALLTPAAAAPLFIGDLIAPPAAIVDYADEDDQALYAAPLQDHRPLRPLLGDPTLDHRFERTLNPSRDLWLADHRIDGTSYLPAASAVAMACAIGEGNAGAALRSIEAFEMVAPMAATGDVVLSLDVSLTEGALAVTGRTSMPHFRCRLVRGGHLAPAPAFSKTGEKISTSNLYRPGFFFHGPRFQTLHSARSIDGGIVVRVDAGRLLPLYGLRRYDRITQWVDAVFQALALDAYRKKSIMALPAAVNRIVFSPTIPGTADVQLRVVATYEDPSAVRGDAVVAMLDGTPLIRLDGVVLRVRANQGRDA